ncbi:hypothetical protein FOMPIDRAFT_64154, partial [Fomitopsis schrenkii]
MRDGKFGVLALQETHLTQRDVDVIHSLFGRRLKVLNSPDPINATAARGVAFVLNREIVDVKDFTLLEVVPGRALLLTLKWHAETKLSLLNIYAPNAGAENETFWQTLRTKSQEGEGLHPDVMLGDFNLVEEAIDRLPMREGPEGPRTALSELHTLLGLHDGWRVTEPSTRDYTFPQRPSTTRSRIDRIYLGTELLSRSFEWDITSTGIPTDHRLVSVRLTNAAAPYLGKGRWTMPLAILADQNFVAEVTTLGDAALRTALDSTLPGLRSETTNPQVILSEFKRAVKERARKIQKTKVPKLQAAMQRLQRDMKTLQTDPALDECPEKQLRVCAIQE